MQVLQCRRPHYFFIFFSFFSSLHCCFINHLQTLVFLIIPTRYVLGKIESAWYVVVFLIRSCQNLGREISPWYCRIQNDRPGLGLDLGDVVAAVVAVAAVELAVGLQIQNYMFQIQRFPRFSKIKF